MQPTAETVLVKNQTSARVFLHFLALVAEKATWDPFIEVFLKNPPLPVDQRKRNRLKIGFFSLTDAQLLFHQYLSARQVEGISNSSQMIAIVLERLCERLVVGYRTVPMVDEYDVNGPLFQYYEKSGLLEAILFGPLFMLENRRHSIPAVNVITPEGDPHCGSGLLIDVEASERRYVLTNRHVVDGNTIDAIIAGEVTYEIKGDPIVSETADLAAVPIALSNEFTGLLLGSANLLQPIIAVGYPRIPTASAQYALFHRGEVNGEIVTTDGQKFLAISCHVSPGNSGGPILSEIGECVGIVTRSNYGKNFSLTDPSEVEASIYHMAIPTAVIAEFIRHLH